MQKKLLMIINPVAGTKKLKPLLLPVLEILANGGFTTTVMITGRRGDASAFAMCGSEYDMVLCCGGDGTLNEVINGMLRGSVTVPLGYIPCGSTNDFANSMGLPSNIKQAAMTVANGLPIPLDVGRFNQRYFTYVASFGIFTSSSYSTPQEAKNLLGRTAYVLEGMLDLQAIKTQHVKIKSDKRTLQGDYVFGAIANSKSFGGIVKLRDELVSLNDGEFEVLLVRMPKTIGDLNTIVNSLYTSNFDNKCFDFFKASRLQIESDMPIAWSLDGEYVRTDGEVEISNLHGVIQFIK